MIYSAFLREVWRRAVAAPRCGYAAAGSDPGALHGRRGWGYNTSGPVVRQSFRPDQLLDMALSVTGKDAERIRQIFRSGTGVFNWGPSRRRNRGRHLV